MTLFCFVVSFRPGVRCTDRPNRTVSTAPRAAYSLLRRVYAVPVRWVTFQLAGELRGVTHAGVFFRDPTTRSELSDDSALGTIPWVKQWVYYVSTVHTWLPALARFHRRC